VELYVKKIYLFAKTIFQGYEFTPEKQIKQIKTPKKILRGFLAET
jgi:hypothetical protein